MGEDRQTSARAAPEPSGFRAFAERLERQKLTLPIALAFFIALAVMCGAAAGVGWVVHHMKTHSSL